MEELHQADCTPEYRRELGGGEPEQERLGGGWRESPSFPCLFELVAVTSMGTAAVFLSPAPGCRRQRLRFCMEVGKAREER